MEDPKEIVIKIKTKNLKQILYFAILGVLILLIILQYFFPVSCPTSCYEEDDQEVEQDSKDLAASTVVIDPIKISTKEKEEKDDDEEEQEQEEEQEETTEEDGEIAIGEEVVITGELYFSIDDVTYEIKGEDWAKVTKIKYTLSNGQSADISPKIHLYLYDDNDPEEIKNYLEEEIILEKLKSGYDTTKTIDVSISFNEIDKEKTLKAVLKNEDGDDLETIFKSFTIS